MNRLTIIGNLTGDPTTRSTQSGNVTTFTVAVNRRGKEKAVDFFRVSAWRQLGENCQKYLAKGRKVAIVGSVSANAYTGKDGEAHASLEVMADDVEFLTPKDQKDGFAEVRDEELPF